MDSQITIIVNADAIIAQFNQEDFHYHEAQKITKKLLKIKANIIYPSTAIAESATHIQRILNSSSGAKKIVETISLNPFTKIAEVNKEVLEGALEYFNEKSSKKNTIFDCIVAYIALENEADAIFSFDKFYSKKGFKLAKELL